ncbi:hypothetical protein BDQ12DRAFT_717216 [Crucibulum laeve]|uniref:Uncharacterized protein n=1 Tax=Crucibulum laeve TaxID=68775 RepID=A0A5C3MF87_9AGAR|nr:hypothetical protein BDQ12DRAFT_717216 [Crucibulum laeve]
MDYGARTSSHVHFSPAAPPSEVTPLGTIPLIPLLFLLGLASIYFIPVLSSTRPVLSSTRPVLSSTRPVLSSTRPTHTSPSFPSSSSSELELDEEYAERERNQHALSAIPGEHERNGQIG